MKTNQRPVTGLEHATAHLRCPARGAVQAWELGLLPRATDPSILAQSFRAGTLPLVKGNFRSRQLFFLVLA